MSRDMVHQNIYYPQIRTQIWEVLLNEISFLNTATIRNFLWPKTNWHYQFLHIFLTTFVPRQMISKCYTNCMANNYALSNWEQIIIASEIHHKPSWIWNGQWDLRTWPMRTWAIYRGISLHSLVPVIMMFYDYTHLSSS